MSPERLQGRMSTHLDSRSRTAPRDRPAVPAFGPLDALLGYVLFYVLVDRATPTLVATVGDVLPDVAPSAVRFWLAATLWFVLVVTVLDQARRQLVALGVWEGSERSRSRWRSPLEDSAWYVPYLALALGGGAVAAWTFDRAVETVVALIPAVAALDPDPFLSGAFVVVVVFFVSFAVATFAIDRVVIGAIRSTLPAVERSDGRA
jgi:hypothetical protein